MNTTEIALEIGQEFRAEVVDLSFEGKAVVRAENGMTFFSEGAWPGERGRFRVRDVCKNYGFADLLEIIDSSDERRESQCPNHGNEAGKCGGCPWLSINYASQLFQKRRILLDALKRVQAEVSDEKIKDVIPSENEFGYRNRAQFKTDGKVIGFVGARSHQIVPIGDCVVLNSSMRERLKKLNGMLPNQNWLPQKHKKWNFIDISEESTIDEIRLNTRSSFKQANSFQNKKMQQWVSEHASNYSGRWVELFAGEGNFTRVIANCGASKIFAIEGNPRIKKVSFDGCDCEIEKIVEDLYRPHVWEKLAERYSALRECDSLFLDPPRKGLFYRTGFNELFTGLKRILYVSCDVGSFVRDIRFFEKTGFEVIEIQPIDQFPQTAHLEIMAELRRLQA